MPWRHAPLSVIVSAPLWCGRFRRATGRSWVCYHLQASGTWCQQYQQERRNGGTADALAAWPPASFHPPRRADGGVCAMLKFSRLFFSKFRRRSVPSGRLPKEPESQSQVGWRRSSTGPTVSRTGFIAVRSLGALQQRFTAGCRMRQAWMSFLQDQGAHSPQCAECAQDPAGSSPLRDVLGRRGRPKRRRHQRTPAAIPMWDNHDRIG
ncbi:hypothetical protein B0T18DRAFT_70965 [Schizothecium vesticola]|uniref:Uncharacterized protein n=1 Tax=Schizothecium vesticola TaxID=314040 RepID=A0AA40K9Y7_9PEZI|nr:hypothetical protein B0T18DRAFT_70965 [Schizothecium vesticola]